MHFHGVTLFADAAPIPGGQLTVIGLVAGGAVCGGLLFLLLIVWFLFRGGKKPVEPGTGLTEDLAAYPPAPPEKGKVQLTVQGRPSRIRLVVVAPVGKRDLREFGEIEDLLNKVVRGLGDRARADKARLRTWPPQLSNTGFAPTFFRNTQRPRGPEAPHWVLLAGPARAGDLPILLGIAVWSEARSEQVQLALEAPQWVEQVRIQT